MIDVLNSGDDIHSRTAYEMFPNVREAVDAGNVRLSLGSGDGSAEHICVKDHFPRERRQAKTLNFGVLYGMSPYRLSNL
jgi:DNA polymerase I-like protein with 3'-5' exonuclease and polymerase domains